MFYRLVQNHCIILLNDMNNLFSHFSQYSHVKSLLLIDGCDGDLVPDLSIMIPTYRRPDLLKYAIESVVQQRNYNITIELVVVDNDANTSDNRIENLVYECLPFNIRLYRNKENIGMFGNWNRCIELARSPKLTILNDDDLLHPDFIKLCYSPIGKEMRASSWVIFGEGHNYIWGEREQLGNVEPFLPVKVYELLSGNPIPGSLGMIMDKDCAVAIGGYDAGLWPTSDYDFTFRYYLYYGLQKTKMVLSVYRWFDNESLKSETISGFLINDLVFRKQVISHIRCGIIRRAMLYLLSEVTCVVESYRYAKLNPEFQSSKVINTCCAFTIIRFFVQNKLFSCFFYRTKRLLWRIAIGKCWINL